MSISTAVRIRVNNIIRSLEQGNINEDNVRSLYGLVREKAPKGSLTIEIADLFAHPEKDRGLIKNWINKAVLEFFSNSQGYITPPNPKTHLFIIDDLNTCLKPYQNSINRYIANQFCLVLFNALQGATIAVGTHIVHLGFKSLANDSVFLIAMLRRPSEDFYYTFAIFSQKNTFNFPDAESLSPHNENNALLVIEFIDGKLNFWQESPHVFPSEENNATELPPNLHAYPHIPLSTTLRKETPPT